MEPKLMISALGMILLYCVGSSEVMRTNKLVWRRDTSVFCNSALGLESGRIKNGQITAYSYDSDLVRGRWFPYYGRLNNVKAWCSSKNIKGVEYLQIDLGKIRHVTAVATQGIKLILTHYYVKKYKIKYSFDGTQWFDYLQGYKYTGNSDGNSVKTNFLHSSFVTRYIRLYPYEYSRDMCMRVELYGCPDNQDCTKIVTASDALQNITSPGYPFDYNNNIHCTWIIRASPSIANGRVSVYFPELDIGSFDEWSCKDKVEVIDGRLHTDNSLGTYCNGFNGKQDELQVLSSSGEYLRIEMVSDGIGTNSKGFVMIYLTTVEGINDVQSDVQCTGKEVVLNCSNHQLNINITEVFYGAHPGSSCDHTSLTSPLKCVSSTAADVVKQKCQHHRMCTIPVNTQVMGSNPCIGDDGIAVTTLLKVFYQCTSTNKTNATVVLPTVPGPTATTTITLPTNQSSESDKGAHKDTPQDIPITLIVISVVLLTVLLVVTLVIILLCRRKKKFNHSVVYQPAESDNYEDVDYDLPSTTMNKKVEGYKGKCVESENLLYESIDVPDRSTNNNKDQLGDLKPKGTSKIYDSCPALTLARITENPLYESSAPSASCSKLDRKQNEYDSVIVMPKKKGTEMKESASVPSISNPGYQAQIKTGPKENVPKSEENEVAI